MTSFAPNRKIAAIIALIAFSAAMHGWSFARQNIEIIAEASPKSALIGDPICINFTIIAPPEYLVEMAPIGQTVGDFSIIETSQEGLHARIVAAIYQTGQFVFPPTTFRIKTTEGNAVVLMSPPAVIEIKSILPGKDAPIKGLKQQAELPDSNRRSLWILPALAGWAIVAAAWILLHKQRLSAQKAAMPLPPQNMLDAAEANLRKLAGQEMPEGPAIKETYIELSQIICGVLEHDLGISALEQTTDEILHSLVSSGCEQQTIRSVESILTPCDLVKFAKYVPLQQEHKDVLNKALGFIKECRDRRQGT